MARNQISKRQNSVRRERHELIREISRQIEKNRVHLSPADQLIKLDTRLGKGVGAVRERERIARKLAVA